MDIKINKGAIGIDVGVAIIIFMLFTGIITMLFYNVSISSIAAERKATATDIAVKIIEDIAVMDYNDFLNINTENIDIPEGYNLSINISELPEERTEDILREYTVRITYNLRDKEENVAIKTLKGYF